VTVMVVELRQLVDALGTPTELASGTAGAEEAEYSGTELTGYTGTAGAEEDAAYAGTEEATSTGAELLPTG